MSNDTDELSETPVDSDGGAVAEPMTRREAIQLLGALPVATFLFWPTAEQERVGRFVGAALESAANGASYAPKFFTPAEFRTVRMLADMIIPRDERSGSASDAGVPEFMDFMMIDRPYDQRWMRPGLAWLDAQSASRFSRPFADVTEAQRDQILNDIAWPARAPAALGDGVRFFNNFRDLTASGFWSSRIGVRDLEYKGNQFLRDWNGCPPAALRKLGVSYDKFDRKKLRLTPG